MDITIVCTHLGHARGGAEINDLHLGSEFEELGHSVTYTFQRDKKRNPIEFDRRCAPVSCPYLYGISYDMPEPLGKVLRHLNQELFVRRLKKHRPALFRDTDMILTTGRPILTRLSSIASAPVFHAVRGSVNSRYHRHLRRADGLVFWGGCEESYEDPDMFETPYITIDPGVNTDLFYSYTNSSVQALSRDEAVPQLLFVGRLEPVKRVDQILQAASILRDDGIPFHLTVIGDGSQFESLKQTASELAIEDVVRFTGRVPHEDIPDYLNASDVFVLSSRMENHPIALKEAMACGTYAVAPDTGRIREMLDSENRGQVYKPNTAESLAAVLETVISTEAYEISTNTGPAQVAGWRENAEELIKLYRTVTG
ncbi:glycosyltransferase family 4 protein [Haloarcula brevis]|uniref:glycosyltransferase family 4 protein n=1 Tax=Haloarcula brevis TaxID=3111453 RepID=UPI00300EE5F7